MKTTFLCDVLCGLFQLEAGACIKMTTVGNRSELSPRCAGIWGVPSDLLSDPEGHPSSGPPLVTL